MVRPTCSSSPSSTGSSRSLIDFAQTMATAQREGWALVALDLGVDTATPGGEMMANVLASFAHASSASAPATAWRRLPSSGAEMREFG